MFETPRNPTNRAAPSPERPFVGQEVPLPKAPFLTHSFTPTTGTPPSRQTNIEPPPSNPKPQTESFFNYLYRGNTQNYGMAASATGISLVVTGSVGAYAAYLGLDRTTTAWVILSSSLVWHPIYQTLNYFFGDRKIIQDHQAQGDLTARRRMWGNRITMIAISEVIWGGLMVPGQLIFAQHTSLSAGKGGVATHIIAAAIFACILVTPTRNLSRWLWRLDQPKTPEQIAASKNKRAK